ncbi:MAG: type II secretion system protein GspG [Polyangiales bacterium]
MSRRALRERSILLPWERKSAWLGRIALRRYALLGMLAVAMVALLSFAYRAAEERARIRTTRAAIAEARRAVTAFVAELGRCPHSLVELLHPPKAGADYLTEVPVDGWGRRLYIRCPGHRPEDVAEVISAGPGGSFLTDDHVL